MRYREDAKSAKLREVRMYFFAQLRALRVFAVKLFGLRAKLALGI